MANYKAIAQLHPAVPVYLRARIWAKKGPLLIYRPLQNTPVFSTDTLGFRHSIFDGRKIAVDRAKELEKYSVVLGSSHCFGFGLPNNACTLASRFAEKLGHPTLNLAYPEANTADLLNALKTHLDLVKLDNVILFPGGSFTRFCYTGVCDAADGPPAIHGGPAHGQPETQPPPGDTDSPEMFDRLLEYQAETIGEIGKICSKNQVRFFVVDEATFFEKARPSPAETEGKLGVAPQTQGQKRFERHKELIETYRTRLFSGLASARLQILDFGPVDEVTFIDEFHYDAASSERMVAHLAAQMRSK